MVFLPQFLYVLQNTPVFLTKSFFKKLDAVIMPFIWNYKSHRIKKDHLIKHKTIGGLSLPNFMHYYWAINIRTISGLLDETALIPKGLQMEREDCLPYSVGAILLSPTSLTGMHYKNNPIINNTIRVVKQLRKHLKLKTFSLHLPISSNPSFLPSCTDGAFNLWRESGLCAIKDLYLNDTFMTFEQLQEHFGLPKSHFFRYLQIRNYVSSFVPQYQKLKLDILDGCLNENQGPELSVAFIYNLFQDMNNPSTAHIKIEWEKELNKPISDEIWRQALLKINNISINTRHCLIQYKTIHRLHYSREKIHKIYPASSPLCEKCESECGTLLHSYALCSKLQPFWHDVFDFVSKVIKLKIPPSPMLIVLGVSEETQKLSHAQMCFVSYSLVIAKKRILTLWKGKDIPTIKMWVTELTNTLHLEKIRYVTNNDMSSFERIWNPLVSFLEDA